MLAIFTIPKPFQGKIDIIQRNAIESWTLLQPRPKIILFGDDDGVAEAADEFGVRHVAEISVNEFGTPLISDVFEKARSMSDCRLLCYVNTDIMLLSDFLEPLKALEHEKRFLVVGRRWDLDVGERIDFKNATWEGELRQKLAKHGSLHRPQGIDYFLYTRDVYRDIPPFAVGRTIWDNWLIYEARWLKVPVIDATEVATVIHQEHDYGHFPGGDEGIRKGIEAERNLELAGGFGHVFTMKDANLLLTPQGLRRSKLSKDNLLRRKEVFGVMHPRLEALVKKTRRYLPKWRRP